MIEQRLSKGKIMKNVVFALVMLLLYSCKKESSEVIQNKLETVKTPTELGQELFEGKGNCVACHLVDQKVIGPSIQDIAKIYKAKNANIVDFLKNDAKPIVDPSQYEVMKTNFVITKAMTEQELKAIEAYIYSN
jgi:cytochrome c